MIFFKTLCLLLFSTSALAVEVGKVRVFSSSKNSGQELELTLTNIGKKSDRIILAHFKANGFTEDNMYAVYKGICETTKCDKVRFKVIGGTKTNIISDNGFYGDFYYVLLSGENKRIYVGYNSKLSKKRSSKKILSSYFDSVGRFDLTGFSTEKFNLLTKKPMDSFVKKCGSKFELILEKKTFKSSKARNLLGMVSHYISEISKSCNDPDYKFELVKIKVLEVKLSSKRKTMQLVSPEKLVLYLSQDTYNPRSEAASWIQSL